MALASLRQVLDYAAEHGFAVPAFNVNKVNIDTDLRMASTGALRRHVAQPENASELDARKIYQAAREAMQTLCQARYEAFGSAGRASKIKVVSLREMARRYR